MEVRLNALGIFFAIFAMQSFAFESDIHYATTYVLARATGFPQKHAQLIASGSQAVDANLATVAALEYSQTTDASASVANMSVSHQAEKNFTFHCFSRKPDTLGSVDVTASDSASYLFERLFSKRQSPTTATSDEALYQLGVAMHCLQDSFSHNGYGGTCSNFAGSCSGHAYDSAIDFMKYSLTGASQRLNPDNPSKNIQSLTSALSATAEKLKSYAINCSITPRDLGDDDIKTLAHRLNSKFKSLSDVDRQLGNGYVVGEWLAEILIKRGLPITESNATILPSFTQYFTGRVLALPDPVFLQLSETGSLVLDKGNPKRLNTSLVAKALEQAWPVVEHEAEYNPRTGQVTYTLRVQSSGVFQAAVAAILRIALIPKSLSLPPLTTQVRLDVPAGKALDKTVKFTNGYVKDYAVTAEFVSVPESPEPWIFSGHPNAKLACTVEEFPVSSQVELASSSYARCQSKKTPSASPTNTTSTPPAAPANLNVKPQ